MTTKTGSTPANESNCESSSEIVYAELNLEKWSIWEPSSTKKVPRARIIERQRILEDGSHVTAKVEIGFTQHGNLSTRDQKIYYVLCKLWDDAGRPEIPVFFSLQKIARLLGEEWSSHAHHSITRSLLQLRGVLFVWENSYFDKTSGEHIERLDTFNILSELSIARRSRKLHATNEQCVFLFHHEILKNLQANHTTPLFLATVLSFKSEIAQMLYPRLDLLLADKKQYERRTKELFDEMGLEGETYRHRSARKRLIERALKELEGAPLTTGCIVSATVEPTKDDADFKIVIQKGVRYARLSAPAKSVPTASPTPKRKAPASETASTPKAQDSAETLLVRYFHQQFHGATPRDILNPKELVSAARLIGQHGLSRAKALIDFAREEAPKTNYTPASLNGILQYESRFEAEYQEREQAQEAKQARQQEHLRAQEGQQARQRALIDELIERVAEVKSGAPQAFTAFLRYVEKERAAFLDTPIARKASAQSRELLWDAYDQPAKRLELFLDFFAEGSDGEAFLALSAQGKRIAQWIEEHRENAQELLQNNKFELDAEALDLLR